MEKYIIIKPLKKARWSGISRYTKCRYTIAPYLSPKGGVETGLTEEDQARLETALGMPKGNLGRTSKFWQEYKIDMDDKPKHLYIDTPEGELAHKFILSHKRVANSMTSRYEWPEAEYVIEDVEEEAKVENVRSRRRIEAMKRFDRMSITEMRNYLKVVGKYAAEQTSSEVIEKTTRGEAESDPVKFLEILNDNKFETRLFIEDLLRIKALRRNGTHVFYNETPIGHDMETAIAYLEDPLNQPIYKALANQLEGSTKSGIERKKEKETSK